MLARLRTEARSPSPAFVLAALALFVALGGTSVAALTLKKNSVRSKHIKNRQVKRPDLATGAVNSAKVADESLLALDFAPGQLPKGEAGERGVAGEKGEPGSEGPPGVADALKGVPSASGGPFTGNSVGQTMSTIDNVPPGSYVFLGYASLRSDQLSASTCSISGGGISTGNARQYIAVTGQYFSPAPSGAWTLSSTSDVSLRCVVFNPAATWHVDNRGLTAIPVTGVAP